MANQQISLLWIDDQLDQFVEEAWPALKTELSRRGYDLQEPRLEAKTVDEAEDALERFQHGDITPPQIVLLDLMFPVDAASLTAKEVDLDAGYFVWYKLRCEKSWPLLQGTPVIVITARGRPEYMDQVIDDPRSTWLSKPVNPTRLAEEIAKALDGPDQVAGDAPPPANV